MVRFKYRYLVVEARQERASPQLSRDGLSDSIKASIQENFGDYGSGILLPTYQKLKHRHYVSPSTVKYFNADTNIAIIRIAREHFRLMWAAITYVVSFGAYDGMIRVVHVGGSMRSCQKHAAAFGLAELRIELATQTVS